MSIDYFRTIAFSKGDRLEQRYLKDVGEERSAMDIINDMFNMVASSRMDVSWLCDMYINREFSLKRGENYKRDRDKLKDTLTVFFKLRQSRRLKISSLFKLASIKELNDAVKPFYNKNEEMEFDYFVVSQNNRYKLYEVTSSEGYNTLTGTSIGFSIVHTPFNDRVFVLEDTKYSKMYGINCLELKMVALHGKKDVESSFKFLITNVISPSEIEKLIPDDLLGSDNMFYQLLKYRYARISFNANNLARIEKLLNNIERVYGRITSKHLYDVIFRTDVFFQGYQFFGALFYYLKQHNIPYDWKLLEPLVSMSRNTMSELQYKTLEDTYGNISST